jgi:hypothetical protein
LPFQVRNKSNRKTCKEVRPGKDVHCKFIRVKRDIFTPERKDKREKKMKQKIFLCMITLLGLFSLALLSTNVPAGKVWALDTAPPNSPPIDASTIDQFVDPLPILDVTGASNGTIQTILASNSRIALFMREFRAKMLPSTFTPAKGTYKGTWVWGYLKYGTSLAVPPPPIPGR